MTDLVGPQQIIFREFSGAAESGWVRGEILCRIAGKMAEYNVRSYDQSGAVSYPSMSGFDFDDAIDELRSGMAMPGTGAWFSAAIQLTPGGRFSMDVDYDNEPAWKIAVVAETYAEEQNMFPRDEEHQPEWYRWKLREAQQE